MGFLVSSETMSVAMRCARYFRSFFAWLDLDLFSSVCGFAGPMFVERYERGPPRQEMVSSRNWVAGNRGWVMIIFFGSGPPQGGGCVPSQGYERFKKKHTVVETNWLLSLLLIIIWTLASFMRDVKSARYLQRLEHVENDVWNHI